MSLLFAAAGGALVGIGTAMALQRSLLRAIMGVSLLVNGVNALLFVSGGLTRTHAPILPSSGARLPEGTADPLPQALVLTSIVIAFGVQAFALVLGAELGRVIGKDDADRARGTDRPDARGGDAEADA